MRWSANQNKLNPRSWGNKNGVGWLVAKARQLSERVRLRSVTKKRMDAAVRLFLPWYRHVQEQWFVIHEEAEPMRETQKQSFHTS